MADIERRSHSADRGPVKDRVKIHPRRVFGLGLILGTMTGKHRGRSLLALVLMTAQAFLFNAVFFTYGLVLSIFYHVPPAHVGEYILPLALGNLWGRCCSGICSTRLGARR